METDQALSPTFDQSEEKELGDYCDSALQLGMERHAKM